MAFTAIVVFEPILSSKEMNQSEFQTVYFLWVFWHVLNYSDVLTLMLL